MKRKIILFSFFSFFLFLVATYADKTLPLRSQTFHEDLTVPEDLLPVGETLTLEEATKLTLVRNLDIQIAKLEKRQEAYEDQIAKSVYDTQMTLAGTYEQNQEQKASIILGSREITGTAKAALQKKIPLGTDIGIEYQGVRNSR